MASNYPLGQTQRREFSDILNQNQNEESGGSSRQSPIDEPADVDETEKKEKQRCMGLKYLAFSIVVCGLLAGVIVAVVFGKKSLTDKRQKLPLGGILSTERPIVECPDVDILHGTRIVFECDFSQNRGVKAVWNNIEWARTEVDYPPSHVNKSGILCNKFGPGFVMRCESDNVTKATCSNNGQITLKLKSKTRLVTYSTTFSMNLQEKPIGASFSTANYAAINGSTIYSVRCSVSGVCKSYQIHIYTYGTGDKKTRIDGPEFKSESSFNNTHGYTIACTDDIKAVDIHKNNTKITCALVDGANEIPKQEKQFVFFPLCCEKDQSGTNCTCPYCNTDKWCRADSKTLLTDKNSTLKCDITKYC